MRATKQGEIYGEVSREEFLREPLTIAHGGGGSVKREDPD